MKLPGKLELTRIIWLALLLAALLALVQGRWSLLFVSLATLALSMLPIFFAERFSIILPPSITAFIAVFVVAAIFLGEYFDFYDRYWWWDIALHASSSLGFGLVGFLFVFMVFQGDRYAAPPIFVAFMSFCFAMTIGALWEIFEFSMDQIFGTNMQKSGLMDTMGDLIVDVFGAFVGAFVGFLFLKGREVGGLVWFIHDFLRENSRLYRKLDWPKPGAARDGQIGTGRKRGERGDSGSDSPF